MALTITETVLIAAEEAANAGNTTEAWQILSDAGDRYAASARDIIEQIDNLSPSSVFTKIVKVQWDRVAPGARQIVFTSVGLQHVMQYLERVRQSEAYMPESDERYYMLPSTKFIEASYRRAVTDHNLPSLTAVDSMFSVLDWNLDYSDEWMYATARFGNTRDMTWSSILEPEMEPSRVVYNSDVFLPDNIQPLREIWLTVKELAKAYGFDVAGEVAELVIDSIGDLAPQIFGLEDPQAIALSAALFVAIDNSINDSAIAHLLDAISLGDDNEEDRRGLQWLMNNYHHAVYGNDLGEYSDEQALFNAAIELIDEISANPSQQYSVIDLAERPANEIASIAAQDSMLGRAYRYALVNLQPFALVQLDNGQPAQDALDSEYDLDQYSQQYLEDRAIFLNTLNTFYLTDASVNGRNLIEFKDEATDQLVMIQRAGDRVSQRFFFGDEGADRFTGGRDNDHYYGGGGNDIIDGREGKDYIEGNAGEDTLYGYSGQDWLFGGAGDDVLISGGADEDVVSGGAGNDHLEGGNAMDELIGGSGEDTLQGDKGHDTLLGSGYYDDVNRVFWTSDDGERDVLEGGEGHDRYLAYAGDVIRDSDGNGIVMTCVTDANGVETWFQLGLFAIHRTVQENVYEEYNELLNITITYTYDKITHTLNVNDWFTIENFTNGDLCLGLGYNSFIWYYVDSYWWNPDIGELSYADDYRIGTDSDDEISTGSGDDTVNAGEGNDTVRGEYDNDVLYGEGGNDQLFGDAGNDTLNGGDGNDNLYGGSGDDILRSGGGSRNRLSGDQGNDTYLFAEGDGNVYIDNYWAGIGTHPLALAERNDVLRLEGITPEDVRVTRSGDYLTLTLLSSGEEVRIAGFFREFGDNDFQLRAVEFADGTCWSYGQFVEITMMATEESDELHGTATEDSLSGLAGDERLYGGNGDDTLNGRVNDYLLQGIEYFDGTRWGYEQVSQLITTGTQYDNRLHGSVTGDELHGLEGNDYLYGHYGGDQLFGDSDNDYLYGESGNDILNGGGGNDDLYGGTGNDRLRGLVGDGDVLNGGEGNDTYLYGLGDGDTTVQNYDTSTGRRGVLRFFEGIEASSVRVGR